MSQNNNTNLREILQSIAPGTEIREGLERIQLGKTGALIVLGYNENIEKICSDGIELDVELSPAILRELSKMDGAILVDTDTMRIRRANVQLLPDSTIPTKESGMRHRTAERTSKQTGIPVISISSSLKVITIHTADTRYTLEPPEVILTKATQALSTLEKYRTRLDQFMSGLSKYEITDQVFVKDIATALQRTEMIRRITDEIEGYLAELGRDGRLISLQLDDLLKGAAKERSTILKDYMAEESDIQIAEDYLSSLSSNDIIDLTVIARGLHFSMLDVVALDDPVHPRGYRIMGEIPRLPQTIVDSIVNHFSTLQNILNSGIEELQSIEGVGQFRAKRIREFLDIQIQNNPTHIH
ncbi:DNA integrity scanning protein DisA [Actinomyces sp. zg-332]|uniref:DNA integrity scanning diadenylate cyclase DisA n=1 Tax=Actinomyces sp. zg-332 TaxID=2708340 RepID=UPI00141F68E6|nr:DNA integrity scanning diadenylate cyclase DisA [Actinomyces sp. zg-332]QPK94045.1 DNA integrity scanning protein DisA [Actinomyces sp. zg-332]